MLALLFLLQTTISIAVPGPPSSAEYLPLRVAEAEGYFAEEGLRVSLRTLPAEPGAAQTLARGDAPLAATSIDSALRLGDVSGAPPRLVFGLTRVAPVVLLAPVALRESIHRPADLAGRTVGIPAPGTPEHTHLVSILEHARVPLHQVSTRSFGYRALAAAVEAGEVAAAMLGEPWASRLMEGGKVFALADLREPGAARRWLGEDGVHAAVFLRSGSAVGTAELVALSRALIRAARRLESGTPEDLATRLPSGVVGLPEEWRARLAGVRPVLIPDGRVTPEMLEGSLKLVRVRSPIPVRVTIPRKVEDLLLPGPVNEALGRPR